MRVGVLGGTFDPPHIGHATVAAAVVRAVDLDRLLWVPVAIPPHRRGRTPTAGEVRRRMVRAAIGDDPRFALCDLELERGGVSYTVDTLRRLTADHPEWSLSLILGADLVDGFPLWKEPEAIVRLAEIVVTSRPGCRLPSPRSMEVQGGRHAVQTVRVTPVEVSSSLVRDRVRRRMAVSDMVTPAVLTIIEGEGLYTGPDPGPERGSDQEIREKQ